MVSSRVTGACLTALTLLLAAAPAVAAQDEGAKAKDEARKAWDAERMTQLTGDLQKATAEVRRAFLREPSYRSGQAPNQRAVRQMAQTLQQLETATRRLHRQVSQGGGYDDTRNTARRIGTLLNDADVSGRSIMTSAFMAAKIQPAMELINQIAPYYGSGPLYDPKTLQRVDRPPNPERAADPE